MFSSLWFSSLKAGSCKLTRGMELFVAPGLLGLTTTQSSGYILIRTRGTALIFAGSHRAYTIASTNRVRVYPAPWRKSDFQRLQKPVEEVVQLRGARVGTRLVLGTRRHGPRAPLRIFSASAYRVHIHIVRTRAYLPGTCSYYTNTLFILYEAHRFYTPPF